MSTNLENVIHAEMKKVVVKDLSQINIVGAKESDHIFFAFCVHKRTFVVTSVHFQVFFHGGSKDELRIVFNSTSTLFLVKNFQQHSKKSPSTLEHQVTIVGNYFGFGKISLCRLSSRFGFTRNIAPIYCSFIAKYIAMLYIYI